MVSTSIALSDQEFVRYQRQITLNDFGEVGQLTLRNSQVLLIGCGGLGSIVAPYLAGAGIGKLVIADDDEVELSNLHRQVTYRSKSIGTAKAEALKSELSQLNDLVSVRSIHRRMNDEQLSLEVQLADVVIDCSDNLKTRHQVNRICHLNQTPLVSGAAIGWQGHCVSFIYHREQACYQCFVPESTTIEENSCLSGGVIGPVVGMIGCLQATEVIRLLLSRRDDLNGMRRSVQSELIKFDGKTMTISKFKIQHDNSCQVCGSESRGIVS